MADGDEIMSLRSDSATNVEPDGIPESTLRRRPSKIKSLHPCSVCRREKIRCEPFGNNSCKTCVIRGIECTNFSVGSDNRTHESSGYSSSTRITDTSTTKQPGSLDTSAILFDHGIDIKEVEGRKKSEESERLRGPEEAKRLEVVKELGEFEDLDNSEDLEGFEGFKKPGDPEIEELDIVDHPHLNYLPSNPEEIHHFGSSSPSLCSLELTIVGDASSGSEEALTIEPQPARKERTFVCTPFALLVSAVIIGLGAPKAIASCKGEEVTTNSLDWIIGVPVAFISFWLGILKEQDRCACLKWFLNDDFRDVSIQRRMILR